MKIRLSTDVMEEFNRSIQDKSTDAQKHACRLHIVGFALQRKEDNQVNWMQPYATEDEFIEKFEDIIYEKA